MQGRLPLLILCGAVLTGLAFACHSANVPEDAVYACSDGKCPAPLECKEGFCVSPQATTAADACTPFTCALLGKNCGSLSDGCGGTLNCGACSGAASCGGGGVANVCGCTPIPEPLACADAGYACGKLYFDDGCNPPKQLSCGNCANGNQVCNAGQCCVPESDTALCASHNISCGAQTLVDNCGQHRAVSCGGCDAGTVCVDNDGEQSCQACVAESDSEFCSRNGFNCGQASGIDNCGLARTVNCGACDLDGGCGGDGVANLCACQGLLSGCSQNAQCCSGTCGHANLCCVPPGAVCNDDSDCCNGECAAAGTVGRCRGDGGL